MGNDGGSIPKRRELVKEAAKALTSAQLKEALNEQQEYGWTTDPLTRKPLSAPIVSDAAGILYNKDSIIEYLLKDDDDREKAEMRKVGNVKTAEGGFAELGCFGDRVSGLKDVVEINFENGVEDEGGKDSREGEWKCPVTGTKLGPGAKACYIVPCGHAFSGSAVKEIEGRLCLKCNEPYAENDIIPILPTLPTDIARLNLRLKTLREKSLTHALKKAPGSKKRKKGAVAAPSAETTNGTNGVSTTTASQTNGTTQPSSKKKESREATPTTTTTTTPSSNNGIKNASTASLTRKVLEEQEQRNKRRKMMENDNVKSLFSHSKNKPDLKASADYMTRGFSIGKK